MRLVVGRSAQPVSADLVHRIDPLGVLLDRWHRGWGGGLVFTASLTPDRVFPRGPAGSTDLMSVAEVVRQAVLAAAHLDAGLPLDRALAMQHVELELERPDDLPRAARLRITVHQRDVRRDDEGVPTATTAHVRVSSHGEDLVRAQAHIAVPLATEFATQGAQRSSGWRSGLARVSAADAGTDSVDDVLLSPGPSATTWRLAVDTTRVRHFDHAVNHVPGMVLLDACLQAWRATDGPAPTRLRASFLRYTRLDASTWITRVGDGTGADEPSLVVTQGSELTTMVGLFAAEPRRVDVRREAGAAPRGPVGRLLALSRPGRSGPRA